MDARDIIATNGLDAYVFVRFLWLMIEMFLPLYVAVVFREPVLGSELTPLVGAAARI